VSQWKAYIKLYLCYYDKTKRSFLLYLLPLQILSLKVYRG